MKKRLAEFIGTFILVFGGCGSALFAAGFHPEGQVPPINIGLVGVSLAFGITVIGCAYAVGGVSGCHLNPAVTLGLTAAGRFSPKEVVGYILSQVLGAVAASALLLFILQGGPDGYDAATGGLAANGFAEHSPGGYSMVAAFVSEFVLTFIFLFVILGATSAHAPVGFAGLAIGLTLTLVHLVGIPITNLSVNPARSTGPAIFVGGWALSQLWLFWAAPIAGAVCAGITSKILNEADDSSND